MAAQADGNTAELLASFAALSTKAQHLDALKLLVLRLDSSERLAISSFIADCHDFANRLPIEVFQHIFDFLPPSSAWTLQLVCRRWRRILGSVDFLLATLGRLRRLPKGIPGAPEEQTLRQAIRTMQAQRLGRPFHYTSIIVPLDEPIEQSRVGLHSLALNDNTLAYIMKTPGRHSEVVVRNLLTGDQHVFCGEARENIMALALSTRVLAFTTYNGALYVVDLTAAEELGPRRLRLPSAHVRDIVANGSMVAVLLIHGTSDRASLAVYSLNNDVLRSMSFAYQRHVDSGNLAKLVPEAILLSSENETIDVFSSYHSKSYPVGRRGKQRIIYSVGHMRLRLWPRVTTAGQIFDNTLQAICESTIPIELDNDPDGPVSIGQLLPIGYAGEFRIRLTTKALGYPQEPSTDVSLAFNATTTILRLEQYELCRTEWNNCVGWKLQWRDVYFTSSTLRSGYPKGTGIMTFSTDVWQSIDYAELGSATYQTSLTYKTPQPDLVLQHAVPLMAVANDNYLACVMSCAESRRIVILGYSESNTAFASQPTGFWNVNDCGEVGHRGRRLDVQGRSLILTGDMTQERQERDSLVLLSTHYRAKLPYEVDN
ncbi:hypothetical protein LTR62_004189 [Meristemomyces frigidus]|uniref:F-box domain-containing protein n=1 Tax=Meristemomyces frigidus TaxID=1508187 RepID=A0AAN7TWV3_9PEZI|nr:hypothetical protein LTR62_004189 [Meristemomyces frigidus]